MNGLLTEREQELYRSILAQGGWVLLHEAMEQDAGAALRLLELGLLFHYEFGDLLNVVNPETAAARLSAGLREDSARTLARADAVAAELADLTEGYESLAARQKPTNVVRHIGNNLQVRHRIVQVESEMREERLAAPPGGARPHDLLKQSLVQAGEFLAAGIVLRTIYQPGARTDPLTAEYCAAVDGLGGQTRVLDEPYDRLLIFDRRVAVIPTGVDAGSAAFVEDPAVVATLVDRFERDWARSEHVDWQAVVGTPRETGVPAELTGLLAAGLTQRAVATRLGVSERTVAAHLARLREHYGAETLVQLGWLMRGEER
ncbi:LuxR C-terminal-related transcriptional regulator [Kitasatospora sp. NPDC088134]|uniref:LuxR C-terminal-related transcriptional regulator n=1 Tax=Kitasatospora sp. NPDC088134 TaxID=3364071 RepID=UPI0038233795